MFQSSFDSINIDQQDEVGIFLVREGPNTIPYNPEKIGISTPGD